MVDSLSKQGVKRSSPFVVVHIVIFFVCFDIILVYHLLLFCSILAGCICLHPLSNMFGYVKFFFVVVTPILCKWVHILN